MKEIQKVIQKLSRDQNSAAGGGGGGAEPVQKHKVTPVCRGGLITFSYYSQNRKSNLWCIDFHKYETYHCLNKGTIFFGEHRLQFT